MRFTKMQGIGNDFVVVDALSGSGPSAPLAELARSMSDRRLGVGADGLILLEAGERAPFRMRMWNPDGSESEMCGNGLRCAALYLRERGHATEWDAAIETGAGVLRAEFREAGRVRIDMGPAYLSRGEIGMAGPADDRFLDAELGDGRRGTAVGMGNPHLIVFVDRVDAVDLALLGPALERHPLFPARTNVHFVEVLSERHLRQRTWERGAGATLACGTGACAVAVASHLVRHTSREVTVSLPGGDLEIIYGLDGRVLMTGPVEFVFEGDWGVGTA